MAYTWRPPTYWRQRPPPQPAYLVTPLVYTATVSGAMAAYGTLTRALRRSVSGAMTSSGALSQVSHTTSQQAVSGAMALAGALANQLTQAPTQAISGGMTSSGALLKRVKRSLLGSLAESGALSTVTSGGVATPHFVAVLTSSGLLRPKVGKHTMSGAMAESGAVSGFWRGRQLSVLGSIALAGTLTTKGKAGATAHQVSGSLYLVGRLATTPKGGVGAGKFSGAMAEAGSLTPILKAKFVALTGTITIGGVLVPVLIVASPITGPVFNFGALNLLGASYRITSLRDVPNYRVTVNPRIAGPIGSDLVEVVEVSRELTFEIACTGGKSMVAAQTAFTNLRQTAEDAAGYWAGDVVDPVQITMAWGDQTQARVYTCRDVEFPDEAHGLAEMNSEARVTMRATVFPGDRRRGS
jgi:hypothetical protein